MEEESRTSQTDVLIIGAGPSGLMAAYWMARCGVKARIIDKRKTKIMMGHADGLRMRTLELFDSMGIQYRVMQEGHRAVEANFWVPGPDGKLIRQGPFFNQKVTESPYHHMLLSQGRIEQFALDAIREHSDLEVERGIIAESLEFDEELAGDTNAYPMTVKLRKVTEEDPSPKEHNTPSSGLYRSNLLPDDWDDLIEQSRSRQTETEIVKAKYIIGCDGAHSWTRKQLNIPLEGSSTDHVWGVIDVIPISNFPDIRRLATITNAGGTILVIPRERNLVRLYVPVQVVDTAANGRFDRSSITPDMIRARVQEVLSPYTFDFQTCDWWTAYQIGQRIAPTFADGNRIFLAGDAVHTHSPKVGLGMNMSMQDGFNIGWKVALVAAGVANPAILDTYDPERHRLAEMLIDFDRHWAGHFTGGDKPPVEGGPSKTESMLKVVAMFENFADGFQSFYGASQLVVKAGGGEGPAMARLLIAGERFPPAKLRKQVDGNTEWTTRLLESDGRFRLIILAGDVRDVTQKQRLDALCTFLEGADQPKCSPLERYTAIPGRFDSPVDVTTIHSAPWNETEFFDFPEILRPLDPVLGWRYEKIWCDDACIWDRDCDGKGYEKWGVDRLHGAMLIVRPDQYIGWAGALEDVKEMTSYLDDVLIKDSSCEV
ncbi:uncharacterized protein N7459_007298 [Penicillium hispanicum]|uniref:uncharacterized protein n=1 Tax=Penicillium hispanicum TaxID=1080232 RepID=UPI0025404820|nr:uncharacterized protein N7459_007298 [Penicillium hispanicum]KAJ5578334.1 hypothetical protein N7459_007298 [Penicillium hispanicum]